MSEWGKLGQSGLHTLLPERPRQHMERSIFFYTNHTVQVYKLRYFEQTEAATSQYNHNQDCPLVQIVLRELKGGG